MEVEVVVMNKSPMYIIILTAFLLLSCDNENNEKQAEEYSQFLGSNIYKLNEEFKAKGFFASNPRLTAKGDLSMSIKISDRSLLDKYFSASGGDPRSPDGGKVTHIIFKADGDTKKVFSVKPN